MGRRRIEMKRVENREARNVTFCKRRTGLFKKLSKLCLLCDSEAAALVYSPGGRVYVFSHPDAPSVFRRFFSGRPLPGIETAFHPERRATADLSAACDEVDEITKAERAMKRWWEETSFEGMDPGKLRRLRRSVAGLRQAVQEKTKQQLAKRDEHAGLMPPLFPAVQDFPFSMPAAVCCSSEGITPKEEVEAHLDQNKRVVR